MFRNISLRAKVLIGIALGCTGYVMLMPDASQTIEPVRSPDTSPGTHAAHGAPAAGGRPGATGWLATDRWARTR